MCSRCAERGPGGQPREWLSRGRLQAEAFGLQPPLPTVGLCCPQPDPGSLALEVTPELGSGVREQEGCEQDKLEYCRTACSSWNVAIFPEQHPLPAMSGARGPSQRWEAGGTLPGAPLGPSPRCAHRGCPSGRSSSSGVGGWTEGTVQQGAWRLLLPQHGLPLAHLEDPTGHDLHHPA